MTKLLMFTFVLVLVTTAMIFDVGTASASAPPPGGVPVVALRSPYFNNLTPGTSVPATINGKSISCYVAINNTVRCVVPKKYKDQFVTINVVLPGAPNLYFRVYVPDISPSPAPFPF